MILQILHKHSKISSDYIFMRRCTTSVKMRIEIKFQFNDKMLMMIIEYDR